MKSKRGALVRLVLSGCLAAGLAGCGKRISVEASLDGAGDGDKKAGAKGEKSSAAQGGNSGPGYHFPSEPGGKLLAELLTPVENIPLQAPVNALEPRQLPVPPALDKPQMPLPPNEAALPRVPLGAIASPFQPRPLPEETPLSRSVFEPLTPERQELPAGLRVRLSSPDVEQPVALPILAQEQPDRASLDDPTLDASVVLALAALMPQRMNPAPFLRLALPDPFEHSQTVRLRTPPAENHAPGAIPPGPPAR